MEADAQNPHMPYIHGGRGPYVRGFITIFMASDMALLFFFFEILKKKIISRREIQMYVRTLCFNISVSLSCLSILDFKKI